MQAQTGEIYDATGGAPTLGLSDIHIWFFSLDRAGPVEWLSPREREAAAAFRFARDRRRYVAGQTARRRILARYCEERADALIFNIADKGRPSLASGKVSFNYSRSEGWGVFAVSRSAILGVDIEAIRAHGDLGAVARQNFSIAEQRALATLSGADRIAGFYNCWSRKEAVVKAMGDGLSAPLSAFDVSLTPEAAPAILRANGPCAPARHWSMQSFSPRAGFTVAVVSDIAAPELHFFREPPH